MTVPTLTPHQRAAARQKATTARRARATMLQTLKTNKQGLADVLRGQQRRYGA